MVGFARFATPYSVGLKKAPAWRENIQSADPLQTFASDSAIRYAQRADLIRDMRFNRSNEFNADSALRNKRERMISEYIDKNRDDPDALAGVYDRFKAKYSRSDGALSNPMVPPSVSEVSRSAPQPLQGARPSGSGNQSNTAPNNNARKTTARQFFAELLESPSPKTSKQPERPTLVIPHRSPIDELSKRGAGTGAGAGAGAGANERYVYSGSDDDDEYTVYDARSGFMAPATSPPSERRTNTNQTPAPPSKGTSGGSRWGYREGFGGGNARTNNNLAAINLTPIPSKSRQNKSTHDTRSSRSSRN